MLICKAGVLSWPFTHAKEQSDIVKTACLSGKVDDETCGGFVAYLQLLGLPVDISGAAVDREIRLPPDVEESVSESERRELTNKSIARKKKAIKKHNATLRGSPPCDECGKRPPKGEEFPLCTGCHRAAYCGKVCQRAAWKKGHKATCKQRKAKGKK